MDGNNEIKLCFSSVSVSKDLHIEKEIRETNTKLKNYCVRKGFLFVDNANIKENCLNNNNLHLSRKTTTLFIYIKKNTNRFILGLNEKQFDIQS